MKTSIAPLALGIMLASPIAAYAGESLNVPNVIDDLLGGSDHSQRAYHEAVDPRSPTRSNPAEPTG